MNKLSGKIAIVTGAGKGIGREAALAIAAEGATVVAVARTQADLDETVKMIEDNGGSAISLSRDLTDGEQVQSMVDTVIEKYGKIDILVNNLGGGVKPGNKDIVGSDMEAILKAFEFNTIVTALCAQYAIPHMIAGGGGSIVNISSETAVVPQLTRSWYGIAKTAVNALTEHIAIQYGRQNVRCNAVMPPFTKTDAVKVLPPEFVEQYARAVPMGRVAEPEDMANAALFLASDEASFITGQCLLVNGGYTLPGADYADSMSGKA